MPAWSSCYKKTQNVDWVPGLPASWRQIIGSAKRTYRLFDEVIVQLATLSKFAEFLAKHENIQIYKIMNMNSRYKSHKMSHSTKLRYTQKYISKYMFIFSALNH
jgi:hypothetical protein